jgi:hypothetical protein
MAELNMAILTIPWQNGKSHPEGSGGQQVTVCNRDLCWCMCGPTQVLASGVLVFQHWGPDLMLCQCIALEVSTWLAADHAQAMVRRVDTNNTWVQLWVQVKPSGCCRWLRTKGLPHEVSTEVRLPQGLLLKVFRWQHSFLNSLYWGCKKVNSKSPRSPEEAAQDCIQ